MYPQNTYLQKSWKAVLRPLCLGFCVLDYYQGTRGVLVGDKRLPPWAGLVQHCSSSSGTHCWRDGPCTSKVSGKLPPWLQLGSSSFLPMPEDKENSTHKKRNQPRRAFPRRVLSPCTPVFTCTWASLQSPHRYFSQSSREHLGSFGDCFICRPERFISFNTKF